METNTKLTKPAALFALCCIGLLAAAPTHATVAPNVLFFHGITHNDATGDAVADGAANLRAEVSDIDDGIGNGEVRFLFTNDSDHSSLTDVYFDDGALLGISAIHGSSGVSFSQGAAPPDLPAGNTVTPPFHTTAGFLADSDPPTSKHGVQNSDATGEWLTIDFLLQDGKSFADVLAALALPAGGDWLRVGLHVQAFAGGFSESFINNPVIVTAIPEPGIHAMLLVGLGLVGAMAHRRLG